jgi:anti-sigma regulatory factor (Ser/Thr protein kinase)
MRPGASSTAPPGTVAVEDEIRVRIASDADMLPARAHGRDLALKLGFSRTDATLIATAISEIARNIVVHVGSGEIVMRPIQEDNRHGLTVIASDSGPGIGDLEAALEHGYASRNGLGLGLPGARRLMDDFDVESEQGRGTTITMTKWRWRDELELLRERRQARAANMGRRDKSDGP